MHRDMAKRVTLTLNSAEEQTVMVCSFELRLFRVQHILFDRSASKMHFQMLAYIYYIYIYSTQRTNLNWIANIQ